MARKSGLSGYAPTPDMACNGRFAPITVIAVDRGLSRYLPLPQVWRSLAEKVNAGAKASCRYGLLNDSYR
jgi:hypothetical protein